MTEQEKVALVEKLLKTANIIQQAYSDPHDYAILMKKAAGALSATPQGSLANLADAPKEDPSLSEAREEIERLRGDLTASRRLVERRTQERDKEAERADGNWSAYSDMIRERDAALEDTRLLRERVREMVRVVRLYCEHDKLTDRLKLGAISNHPYFARTDEEPAP